MTTFRSLRVVFFGTPEFAVPTLDALLASRHHVVGVVTQPDRPSGRGQKVHDAPVKARAIAAGLPVLQPASLKTDGTLAALRALAADIGVVAAYGKILTDAVLAIPPMGMVNVHASLLPKYRGAAPIHRAVIAGERETGVTIMRVVKALDAGAMLATVRVAIGPDARSDEIERELAVKGSALLVETVDRLAAGPIDEQPQNDADATYAHRLTKEDSSIDWSRSAHQLHDQIRGLHPWPLASSYLNGKRLILRRSALTGAVAASPAGSVTIGDRRELYVATGHGTLQLLEVQSEGKRPMTVHDFMSGARLSTGDRFTPAP